MAKRQRFLNVLYDAMKWRSASNQVRYKFGVGVPRTYSEALQLDCEKRNTLWQDGIQRELDQLSSYCTFHDIGVDVIPGDEYHRIKVRFIFDAKADGKQKG